MERKYQFSDGVLTFNVDTATMDHDELVLALNNAVRWSKADLTVDISRGDYIASRTIGQLVHSAVEFRSRKLKLTVVCGPKVALMLRRTGFGRVGTIQTVGED